MHSFHVLARLRSKSFKLGFSSMWTKNFQLYKLDLGKAEEPEIKLPTSAAAAAAKSLQSCPTLCDPIDGSPPGSPIPGILQARTLEWVAISFSNAWKWKVKVKWLSRVRLLATPWTVDYQALLSIGFSRQEHWSVLPCPSPGDLLDPVIEPVSLTSPELAGRLPLVPLGKPKSCIGYSYKQGRRCIFVSQRSLSWR